MDPIYWAIVWGLGGLSVSLLFLMKGEGEEKKINTESFEYFFDEIEGGRCTIHEGIRTKTYVVPDSSYNIHISRWDNAHYGCNMWCKEKGDVFELTYKLGEIVEFKNMNTNLITLENMENVKSYILSFLENNVREMDEKDSKSEIINNMMKTNNSKNDDQLESTLDEKTKLFLQEMKRTINYISNYKGELSLEEAHYFEQIRVNDLPNILSSYQQLDPEKKESEKNRLEDGLHLIRLELDAMKGMIQSRTARQFEKSIEIVHQRRRDRESESLY